MLWEIHFGKVVNGGGRANKGSHPKLSPDESPGWKSSLVRKSDLDRRVLANKLFCHQPTESCKKYQIEISILLHQGTNHQKWRKPDKSNQYALHSTWLVIFAHSFVFVFVFVIADLKSVKLKSPRTVRALE